MIDRGGAGGGEFLGTGGAARVVDAESAAADALAGVADLAGICQHLDKGALDLRLPPVNVLFQARDGGEGGD